jgi:hypothetical protein
VHGDKSRKCIAEFLVLLLLNNLLLSIDVLASDDIQALSDLQTADDVRAFTDLQNPDDTRASIDIHDSSANSMILDVGYFIRQACRASFVAACQSDSPVRALALNHPPQIPSAPTGPSIGLPGTPYNIRQLPAIQTRIN